MKNMYKSHYDYLDQHFTNFARAAGASPICSDTPDHEFDGVISAHGDKGYGYRQKWEEAGIPFCRGMMLYLLGRLHPFAGTFEQPNVCQWVIENYHRFSYLMP
jgi:hypothetical protein